MTGVYVIGMHRSGTSALARVINLLGVPIALDDPIPPNRDNPTGFWETEELRAVNESLLRELRGRWNKPPPISRLVDADRRLAHHLERARQRFEAHHPEPSWVWKDPRTTLLLRFWRAALPGPSVAVVSHRDPADIARSLRARNGYRHGRSLSMWSDYATVALRFTQDMPRTVVRYNDLIADPVGTARELDHWLDHQGVERSAAADLDAITRFVNAELRHASGAPDSRLNGGQRRLVAELDALSEHAHLAPDRS